MTEHEHTFDEPVIVTVDEANDMLMAAWCDPSLSGSGIVIQRFRDMVYIGNRCACGVFGNTYLERFHRLGHADVSTEYDAGCPYCNPQVTEPEVVDTTGVNTARFAGLEVE